MQCPPAEFELYKKFPNDVVQMLIRKYISCSDPVRISEVCYESHHYEHFKGCFVSMTSLLVHKRFYTVSGKKPFPAFFALPQYIRMLRLPSINVLHKLSNIINCPSM